MPSDFGGFKISYSAPAMDHEDGHEGIQNDRERQEPTYEFPIRETNDEAIMKNIMINLRAL